MKAQKHYKKHWDKLGHYIGATFQYKCEISKETNSHKLDY